MLTPLELDIMKAVWEKPPVTVKDVQATIRPHRKLAYTTVMTIMHRMHHKGLLTRRLKSRAHLYEPSISYIEVRDAEVDRLIDNFFAGSPGNLMDFLDRGPKPAIHAVQGTSDLDDTLL